MTKREIALLRLRSQRLSESDVSTPEAVVGWLGCTQAQDYAPGKWSIGQRAVGLSDSALDVALAEGRILRTHILRPTWHFVLPQDIRQIQALTGPRNKVISGFRRGAWGLDDATLQQSNDVLAAALIGKRLMRTELQQALADAGIEAVGPRLAYLVMYAELECLITSGGLRGKQQTYALLDEIAPVATGEAPDRDETLAEFTRRYFTSHGPSTIDDFTWWSSLAVADVKRGLELVGDGLEKRTIDGLDYWADTFDLPAGQPSPRAHFIQGLDEYFVGYRKTRSAADVAGIGPIDFNGGFYHVLLIDGQVTASVRRVVDKSAVTFETRLSRALTPAEKAEVDEAAARYATFLDSEVTVRMVA